MAKNNYDGIVICGETISIDVMLPKQDIADPHEIKKQLEEELKVQGGNMFIPYKFAVEEGGEIDFGEYGRRWHIRVVINKSQRENFYDSLCMFCRGHNLSLWIMGSSSIQQ